MGLGLDTGFQQGRARPDQDVFGLVLQAAAPFAQDAVIEGRAVDFRLVLDIEQVQIQRQAGLYQLKDVAQGVVGAG